MSESLLRALKKFDVSVAEFKAATSLTKYEKAARLMSQVDVLSHTQKGLSHILESSLELESAGIFEGSAWNAVQQQEPSLVKGTLLSGHPNSSFEILSELRILAYALGQKGDHPIDPSIAHTFLEEVVVHNMEFAFDELTEESRSKLTQQERKKIVSHFKFLLQKATLDGIKSKLLEEIKMVCAQRPIVTQGVRNLIQTVYQKLELDERVEIDMHLLHYVNAVYSPTNRVFHHPNYEEYQEVIKSLEPDELIAEAKQMGRYLDDTGLSNPYMSLLLRYLVSEHPDIVPELLCLKNSGVTEWQRYPKLVSSLVLFCFDEYNHEGIYGLKRMLERGLFSRRAVRAGLTNLKLINIHPEVERRVLASIKAPGPEHTAKEYIISALLGLLGHPLGIGQGNNATCQSARGISMWAQHAPSKLINMITTAVSTNNLMMRFEHHDLESLKLSKGLVDKLDHKLDAVSLVLVPHLDKIYNAMMTRSAGRSADPHKWTNPALYGHWIQTGFASAYSYVTNSIEDFEGFARLFYACFHPLYSGGRKIVYPNPVGLVITSSTGVLLGFHAISLLRIDKDPKTGSFRAYFLNPNNEGRQNWGQGIRPTVFGHGENNGESSLPVDEFVARIYAFHYDSLIDRTMLPEAPSDEIGHIVELAESSWGKKYLWNKLAKVW